MEKSGPSSDKQLIHILIVDDHPLFRSGLDQAIQYEDDMKVIGQSADGQQAIKDFDKLKPDVVLLDVNLPEMNGLQVAKQLKSRRDDIGIIILTAYHDVEQVIHAIRAGASSYCPKDIRTEHLISIIRDVSQGYIVINQQRMNQQQADIWIEKTIRDLSGEFTDTEEHFIPLSPRETEILECVTEGMSNKEIAAKLSISQQTVKNHMTSVLRKLNVEDRTQAAVTALRRGWVRLNETPSANTVTTSSVPNKSNTKESSS